MSHVDLENFKVEKKEGSSVCIEGEIAYAELEKHRAAAVAHLGKDVEIDGFRKGHVPEKVLIERVGEMALLSEMADRALRVVYPEILKQHELDVIGYPQIEITKLAKDNPLGFKATVAIIPEVTLPDAKVIAKEKNENRVSDEVTEEEIEKQINDILRQKVAYERLQNKAAQNDGNKEKSQDNVTELPTPETVAKEEEPEIPELTDELVKTLGQPGQFEDVAGFKAKMREHLEIQKKEENAARHRASITDAIIEKSTIELPEVMIEAELGQMFAQMEEDLKRAQLSMDDYLTHIKKTREELKKEWQPAAEKRAKLQLVLNEIAKQEKIEADPSLVDHEVSHLLEHYKDADESRVRTYVTSVLQNEAVMKMLENA